MYLTKKTLHPSLSLDSTFSLKKVKIFVPCSTHSTQQVPFPLTSLKKNQLFRRWKKNTERTALKNKVHES